MPNYVTNLPTIKAVTEAKDINDIDSMFGPQDGIADYGGSHFSSRWSRFTMQNDGRLHSISIFAIFSTSKDDSPAKIDVLKVEEGFFHSVGTNSHVERIGFKTGDQLEAEYQARLAQFRMAYPLPLRALIEARQTPDEHDLVSYKKALNEVRKKPNPELFQQLASSVGEGTCLITGILDDIVFDSFLRLEKWEKPQRVIALQALVEALPRAEKGMDLEHLVVVLLAAEGGGHLKIPVHGTRDTMDIKVEVSTQDPTLGPAGTYGETYISGVSSPETLEPAAKACRDKLKEMFPELR